MPRWIPVAVAVAITALIGVVLTTHDSPRHAPAPLAIKATPTTSTSTTSTTNPPPTSIAVTNALQGEGQWNPAGRMVNGQPAVYVTDLRPPAGGSLVGVAELNLNLLKMVVYAGTDQPAGNWSRRGYVPADQRPSLVASFNGGFQFGSSEGGFYADGAQNPALRDGAASLITRTDGSAEVVKWGRDATLTPDIAQVRQNLTLLVDGGVAAPDAANSGQWGATLSHTSWTWRSAVGSDFSHHLFFVGGPGLTPASLASVMVAVGAMRAMELDINPQWVFFNSYTPTGGAKLLPSMNYAPEHVLVPFWRDFVAAFARF
jgi:hypothetical protein